VTDEPLAAIREAYNALTTGDVTTFAAVLDRDVHWRGVPRGIVRKRHPY
jgi:ketosteroid isomerase-like protein